MEADADSARHRHTFDSNIQRATQASNHSWLGCFTLTQPWLPKLHEPSSLTMLSEFINGSVAGIGLHTSSHKYLKWDRTKLSNGHSAVQHDCQPFLSSMANPIANVCVTDLPPFSRRPDSKVCILATQLAHHLRQRKEVWRNYPDRSAKLDRARQ